MKRMGEIRSNEPVVDLSGLPPLTKSTSILPKDLLAKLNTIVDAYNELLERFAGVDG